jgi:hypothetical protein
MEGIWLLTRVKGQVIAIIVRNKVVVRIHNGELRIIEWCFSEVPNVGDFVECEIEKCVATSPSICPLYKLVKNPLLVNVSWKECGF